MSKMFHTPFICFTMINDQLNLEFLYFNNCDELQGILLI